MEPICLRFFRFLYKEDYQETNSHTYKGLFKKDPKKMHVLQELRFKLSEQDNYYGLTETVRNNKPRYQASIWAPKNKEYAEMLHNEVYPKFCKAFDDEIHKSFLHAFTGLSDDRCRMCATLIELTERYDPNSKYAVFLKTCPDHSSWRLWQERFWCEGHGLRKRLEELGNDGILTMLQQSFVQPRIVFEDFVKTNHYWFAPTKKIIHACSQMYIQGSQFDSVSFQVPVDVGAPKL
jgi:hypothetical protein